MRKDLSASLILTVVSLIVLFVLFNFTIASGDDGWPMWRYDQNRSATAPHELTGNPKLHWVRELPAPQRAWPWQMDDFEKLAFDKSYEPVAADGMLFVPSMVVDKVSAYSTKTGEVFWHYYVDGPVRFAPLYHEGKLYFVSDDGHLYCIDGRSGEKIWKFRAAHGNRLVLGNERLISMWPARGGPVIEDGTIYFAAGLWPHEGVYIYALDAETAEVQWVNSGSQSDVIMDPKRFYSFGGVAPQGQLVVQNDRLIVPGGRTAPAVYDRHTGDLQYYNFASSTTDKGGGGHSVFTGGDWFFNVRDYTVTHMYWARDGAQFGVVNVDLTTEEAFIGVDPGEERISAYSRDFELIDEEPPQPDFDRLGRPLREEPLQAAPDRADGVADRLSSGLLSEYYELRELWTSDRIEGLRRIHIKTGSRLYGSGENGRIFAVNIPEDDQPPQLEWKTEVDGEVFSIIAAHGRLFVTTESGRLYCFGPGERETIVHEHDPEPFETKHDIWTDKARELLEKTETRGGYGLMFGLGSGRLLEELLQQSEMHITAFDPDPMKVDELRERYAKKGLYGKRVVVHQGDATSHRLPPYIAGLVASEDPEAAGFHKGSQFAEALFHSLRPYGGVAYLALDEDAQQSFIASVQQAGLEKAELIHGDNYAMLTRPGSLPGSASWSHQYADAGNTAYTPDKRVKAPLGVAWFGGEPNHKTLPRHMHGPIPQVVEGRQILMGPHHVSARCAYTGVELWATELPKVGANFTDYEYEEKEAPVYFPNSPGANFVGSPMASAQDAVYVLHEEECLRLDAATGEKLNAFAMPEWEDLKQHGRDSFTQQMNESYGGQLQEGEQKKWGNIRYMDDFLIAAAYPHMFDDRQPGRRDNWNQTSSEFIIVMDRHSGEIQWVHQASFGFRHNAIVAGNGKIFVIDNLSKEVREMLGRRGIEPDIEPEIRALDLRTGELLWTFDENVFGTALAYSEVHDILLQSGHDGRRRALPDEPRDHMLVLKGETGEKLWERTLRQRRSPLGLHDSWGQIIGSTGEGAVDMYTGETLEHRHPVTGQTEPWLWVGALRCGTQNYSEHLVAFRSGAAGIADLNSGGMTGNITGFRAGCTNNLVVADGMFNAPEYTRSCSCSYQHQTSVGLTHMPDIEMWSYGPFSDPQPGSIEQIGINFAAPGKRMNADSDVLWVEYPVQVEPGPYVPVEIISGSQINWFRQHATWINNYDEAYPWVGSYGGEGIEQISVNLVGEDSEESYDYDVVLYFTEPKQIETGERVFDVLLQGKKHVSSLDIKKMANGSRQVYSIEVNNITVEDALEISFEWDNASRPAVISGIKLVRSEL